MDTLAFIINLLSLVVNIIAFTVTPYRGLALLHLSVAFMSTLVLLGMLISSVSTVR